ncbi:hypothetical protein BJ322DRAFT_304727 [Thelephora terrestris]|uniref:ubiquitinyl hydrolase 1 n=1 Tax=Thelephora terrestris TaxID=56493 RepID=A0A9P6L264_9AGAM|nr:hypothetical protein BJ322DRAFT_304727 [Thelephora terrestris]
MSGTYCFMNSVVQAFASLSYLRPQIEDIHARAVALDVETPVIDSLRDLLHALNIPHSSPRAIKPIQLINALSVDPEGRTNPLLFSREHQDAQELFQLLSECIKREATAVDKEYLRDRGLGAISNTNGSSRHKNLGFTVFDGLTANRRSCVVCGYTEAVMHFSFDNWQLAVPRVPYCTIYDCLHDYTRLEKLTDCICRKCSVLATHQKLLAEAERMTALMTIEPNPSPSRKKRVREARKLEGRVKTAIEEGRIEEDIPGVKLEKVYSKESTKQVMVARAPHVLTLHLNRSLHFGYYASKNTCQVEFPEFLDLSPFATSGQLSTKPDLPISSPHQLHQLAPSATQSHHRTLYQLSAVVCHYGQHSYGHYICYRRKPRPVSAGAARFFPPKLPCPWDCRCERCIQFGPIRVDDGFDNRRRPGYGWLRISDDSVQEVGFETVALESSSAFMLFYEKVLQPRVSSARQQATKGSEDTVRPEDALSKEPKLAQEGDTQSQGSGSRTKDVQPRVVRNVSTRRPDSPIPQPKPKAPGLLVSTPSLMRGGSYYNAQSQQPQSQPQANGHVRMPATASESWYRPASPPQLHPPPHSNSPSKSQSRVPVPSTTAIQYQPQRLQI